MNRERRVFRPARHRVVRLIQTGVVVLLLLLVWQAGLWAGLLPSMTPNALQVLAAIAQLLVSPTLWTSIGQTLLAALIGWTIAAVLGIVLGMAFGASRLLQRATAVMIDFGRSFPVLALLPVVILMLGATLQMKVFLVALACFWPIIIQAIAGSRRMDMTVRDTVRVHRIPFLLAYWRVRIPSALPFIATGVRIAATMAVLAAVAVEVLTETPGLGRQITITLQTQSWDLSFAYLFFTGVLGWGIVAVLQKIEDRLLRWNRRAHD